MSGYIYLTFVLVYAATLSGQSKPDGQTRREACVATLSTFVIDPATLNPPRLPDDLSGVAIEYFASGCFGSCPSFTMRVQKDKIEWVGREYVKKKGNAETHISEKEFETWVKAWQSAKMYAMRDDYCEPTCPDGTRTIITDVQDTSISFISPSYSKKVLECFTTIDGKPENPRPPDQYFQFSHQLIELAKSKHWL